MMSPPRTSPSRMYLPRRSRRGHDFHTGTLYPCRGCPHRGHPRQGHGVRFILNKHVLNRDVPIEDVPDWDILVGDMVSAQLRPCKDFVLLSGYQALNREVRNRDVLEDVLNGGCPSQECGVCTETSFQEHHVPVRTLYPQQGMSSSTGTSCLHTLPKHLRLFVV